MNRRDLMKIFGALLAMPGIDLPTGSDDDEIPSAISPSEITGADQLVRFIAMCPSGVESAYYNIGLRGRSSGLKYLEWQAHTLLPLEWMVHPQERLIFGVDVDVFCTRPDVKWVLVYTNDEGGPVRIIAGETA